VNIYTDKSSWAQKKYSTPYPFAQIDDFLTKETYNKLTENFPSLKEFEKYGDIKANNIQIRKCFQDIDPNKDSIWYEFGNNFVTDNFFYSFCQFYKEDIKYWYPQLYKKIINRSLKIGVSGVDSLYNCDVILDFQIAINTPVFKKDTVRGPHLDNLKELYAGLCYLKDSDDYTDSGHFTVFKKKPFRLLRKGYGRSFQISDLIESKKIKYKSNRVATFLNTMNSIHGVSEREVTDKLRKFFVFNAVINEQLARIPLLKKIMNVVKFY